jgi:hypothetical protein
LEGETERPFPHHPDCRAAPARRAGLPIDEKLEQGKNRGHDQHKGQAMPAIAG